jgi:hypothetical protein
MFTDVKPARATTWRAGWYDLNIGSATGQMSNPKAGLYRRDFTGGVALANLGTASQTIPVVASCRRVPQTATLSSVTLTAKSGAVLQAA